uniref:THAP-type domain-containing protein n=1 Tax=Poecilia latipinna TaxID=48699 RepID=A0A3B3VZZ0_9TELE
MPKRCVAAGCCNYPNEHISLFSFPKDEKLRDQWTQQVQRTRGSWLPTPSSVLCSEHFTADCFEELKDCVCSNNIFSLENIKTAGMSTPQIHLPV